MWYGVHIGEDGNTDNLNNIQRRFTMRKIKASTLVPGRNYHFALYADKSAIMPCKIISRPETQIGLMTDSDRYVIEKEDGTRVQFRRNSTYPHFLVTDVPGKREGILVQDRVVFFGEDLPVKVPGVRGRPKAVKTETVEAAVQAFQQVAIQNSEVTVSPEAVEAPEKPKKEDYASFGDFMKACKERKKFMREHNLTD